MNLSKTTIKLIWSDEAWEDYLYSQDKKTLKKINNILKDIKRNGYKCISKSEPLSGNFSGFWSVRIDSKNQIVFNINDEYINIAQCRAHYLDK